MGLPASAESSNCATVNGLRLTPMTSPLGYTRTVGLLLTQSSPPPRNEARQLSSENVNRPPSDQPFVWHQAELLRSPAWRARSINTVRFVEFLLVEHMAHSGQENGLLLAPYDQLEAWGIGRRFISDTIDEAEALGLVAVARGGKKGLVKNHLSRYRLTFYATQIRPEDGSARYWIEPTDEWRRLKTLADIETAVTAARADRGKQRSDRKNRKQVHEGKLVRVHEGELDQCTKVNSLPTTIVEDQGIRRVHEGEPLYISRVA